MLKYGLYMFYCILHLFILLCVSMRACIPCYTVHEEDRGKTCKRWFFPVVLGINSSIRLGGKSYHPPAHLAGHMFYFKGNQKEPGIGCESRASVRHSH